MKIRVFNGVAELYRQNIMFNKEEVVGADIYLSSEYDRKAKENDLDMKRLALDNARQQGGNSEEERAAYEEALIKTEEGTYYRDSYNSSNLAWLVGLSYWQEGEHLDKDGKLPPLRCAHWLNTLQQCDIKAVVIDAHENWKKNQAESKKPLDEGRYKPELGLEPNEKIDDVVEYFERKKQNFMMLLAKAIELNEGLDWSV